MNWTTTKKLTLAVTNRPFRVLVRNCQPEGAFEISEQRRDPATRPLNRPIHSLVQGSPFMTHGTRTFCAIIVVAMCSVAHIPTSHAKGELEIHKGFVKFDGLRWFRKNSQQVSFGDVGLKVTPVAGSNGLEKKDTFRKLLKGNWKSEDPISTQGKYGNGTKFSVGATIGGLFGLTADQTSKLLRGHQCKFSMIHVKHPGRLVTALNNNPKELDKLRGNKSRAVTAALVVESCKLTESQAREFKPLLKFPVKQLVVNINADSTRNSTGTINLAEGSILGYQLSKPVWEKKLKKKTSALKDLKVDPQGL